MTKDVAETFRTLRQLFSDHERKCALLRDDEKGYFLGSREILLWNGERIGFGGVEIRNDYVSAHLMPLKLYPDMATVISDDLRKCMHGQTFFKFKKIDPWLIAELGDLIAVGIGRYKEEFRI